MINIITIIITHHHSSSFIIIHHEHHQELSRCQGWPDDMDWNGLSKAKLGGAIGNSWPLNVSVQLVQSLVKCLNWEGAYL